MPRPAAGHAASSQASRAASDGETGWLRSKSSHRKVARRFAPAIPPYAEGASRSQPHSDGQRDDSKDDAYCEEDETDGRD